MLTIEINVTYASKEDIQKMSEKQKVIAAKPENDESIKDVQYKKIDRMAKTVGFKKGTKGLENLIKDAESQEVQEELKEEEKEEKIAKVLYRRKEYGNWKSYTFALQEDQKPIDI